MTGKLYNAGKLAVHRGRLEAEITAAEAELPLIEAYRDLMLRRHREAEADGTLAKLPHPAGYTTAATAAGESLVKMNQIIGLLQPGVAAFGYREIVNARQRLKMWRGNHGVGLMIVLLERVQKQEQKFAEQKGEHTRLRARNAFLERSITEIRNADYMALDDTEIN